MRERKNTIAIVVAALLLSGLVTAGFVFARGAEEVDPDEVTITIWNFLDEEDQEDARGRGFRAVNDAFREKYPNVKLETEIYPWDRLSEQLLLAHRVGEGPDVVRLTLMDFKRHVDAGSVRSLNEFIEEDWPEDAKTDFVLPWEAEYAGFFDGHKYALPLETRMVLYWYRADAFREEGISVPEAWDDLAEATEVLTGDGKYGFAVAFDITSWSDPLYWFMSMYGAFDDARIIDEDYRAVFNNEAGVEIFGFLRELVEERNLPTSMFGWTGYDLTTSFAAGTVLSSSEGSHRVLGTRRDLAEGQELAVAPLPGPHGPAPIYAFSWSLAIPTVSENPEWAWKYLDHAMSPEIQALYTEISGEKPSRYSSLEEPYFQTDDEGLEIKQWFEFPDVHGTADATLPLETPLLGEAMTRAAHEIVLEGQPIEETLDRQAEWFNSEVGR